MASAENEGEKEHVITSNIFIPRYNGPSVNEMTDEQKSIRDSILASRKGTGLSGPFGPWIAIPSIAQPSQQLGKACRYDTSLKFHESELIILLTGAKTKAHAEFDIHVGEAIKSGISMKIINAIPRDDEFSIQAVHKKLLPLFQDSPRDIAIIKFVTELLCTYGKISDETYETTKAALGGKDSVLVEITSIVGYYTYVSYTLNVFNIPYKPKK